jgi:hypothetical protein
MTNIYFWEHTRWAKAYIAAMLEDNPVELPRRIATAHAEIEARLAKLVGQKRSVAGILELDSLDDALSDLARLVEHEPAQPRPINDHEANLEKKGEIAAVVAELGTEVCPACKQLKLLDKPCESAFCQEMRRAAPGMHRSARLRRLVNSLRARWPSGGPKRLG